MPQTPQPYSVLLEKPCLTRVWLLKGLGDIAEFLSSGFTGQTGEENAV